MHLIFFYYYYYFRLAVCSLCIILYVLFNSFFFSVSLTFFAFDNEVFVET